MLLSVIKRHANRRGALLPMLAVVMLLLMVVVSMGVDIARMHLTRSELRTANDAAARAAVVEIGKSQNVTLAENAAMAVAQRNMVAGKGMTLQRQHIQIGHAEQQPTGDFLFTEGGPLLTSARVSGFRSENSPDGPVSLLFGPMFGVDQFSTNSSAAATQTHRDIALVLDVSGSMQIDNRFGALQEAVAEFLKVLDESPHAEHVSLVVYSSSSRKLQPLTTDYSLINTAFALQSPGGATAIGKGMRDGIQSVKGDTLARPHALKSLVVMTDGRHNTGVGPNQVASEAAANGISVYSVTFSAGADKGRMKRAAKRGRGKHVHADNKENLKKAFEDIARQLSVSLIE